MSQAPERLGAGAAKVAPTGDGSLARVQRRLGSSLIRWSDRVLGGLSATARAGLPRPARDEVEVVCDIPYRDRAGPAQRLDVYRPIGRPKPWPVVLYVHGGGFATLSKASHWVMAEQFVRQGFLVFTIDYRLAPMAPFPAAIEDTCAAYCWVLDNAAAFGGDPSRLVVAGESAGANLVTSLSIAATYRRPEPYAAEVFSRGRVPDVAVPACGLFQVSDVSRLWRRRRLPPYVRLVLSGVSALYLRGHEDAPPEAIELADPLRVFESGRRPERPLPAFFVPVGTRDPLLDDTRRLARALEGLGAAVETCYYRGEYHVFHAAIVRSTARACWCDTFAFIDQHLHRAARARGGAAPTGDDPGAAESAA